MQQYFRNKNTPASETRRFLSNILDLFISIQIFILYLHPMGYISESDFSLIPIVSAFYEIISTLIFGESIGRKIMNIKVVSSHNTDISYKKRFARQFLKIFLCALYICCFFYWHRNEQFYDRYTLDTKVISKHPAYSNNTELW